MNRYLTTVVAVLMLWALPIASLLTGPPDLGCHLVKIDHALQCASVEGLDWECDGLRSEVICEAATKGLAAALESLRCSVVRLKHVVDSPCFGCVWPCQCWATSRIYSTKIQMGRVEERLRIYEVKHGELPRTLSEVELGWHPRDAWGNTFEYSRLRPKTAVLTSYGWDGAPGNACGIGEAVDLTYVVGVWAEQ